VIAWVLWWILVLHLFLLEGVVAARGLPVLDLSVAICLFMALFARPRAVPGLLISTALARAALVPGSAALHVLALGIPVAVLLPLRGVLSRNLYLWQCAVTAFLAITQPRLLGLLGRLTSEELPVGALGAQRLFWAMLLLPPLVSLLRRLPPLRLFQESSE
jgi:hypothetical protein